MFLYMYSVSLMHINWDIGSQAHVDCLVAIANDACIGTNKPLHLHKPDKSEHDTISSQLLG